ncbi:MAG TPA: type II toxin-antitoxin system RelE/ParE family toxin [Gemmataceae bacterium]|nr:type II toxin-antitoxin system RelE/ParE family toxin [Gemmataceae bacterium]
MTLPLVFRAAAQHEFDEAALRYEAQRRGLGTDFVARVQQVLDEVGKQPNRYPIVLGNVREAPVARFPFCIYYRAKRDRIVILSVFHCSRDPAVWQARIKP